MSIISDAKELGGLIKKIGDIDLERRIVTLQGEIIDLTQTNNELITKNQELEKRLKQRDAMTYKAPVYYAANDPIPLCPVCWEGNEIMAHLSGPHNDNGYITYSCNVCGKTIYPQTTDTHRQEYQEPKSNYGSPFS